MPVNSVVTRIAVSTVASLSSTLVVESEATNPATTTARRTVELSCVLPITPGTKLINDVTIITTEDVTSAIPIPYAR